MKLVILAILIFSSTAFAQVDYTEKQMQQKTMEALAKFYKADVAAEEAFRRLQEKHLPKELKPYIPYFATMFVLVRDQKFVYRRSF